MSVEGEVKNARMSVTCLQLLPESADRKINDYRENNNNVRKHEATDEIEDVFAGFLKGQCM